ncbi:type 1 glutamine amidotransferase domain-containing protein [Paraburkholderia sabiae]|jgi:putative intracellular protease/amidase|uniref:Type 1 glutamine amidotransferase domain-containing protein n=1 Tax=Paraburkholderia sabiae TaxID=273251 RepID=A0ABU9Q6P0_9BURK|nr:type 1 glutamine amidotransferase domain-containing protein [Paraburkholderia sabiae]WJZ78783.1 type 1 glutamine amidotransferase domain-containing protein [Paraburkholderia sabiae]CAD6512191.1 Protein/nucleic acid deglycase HchA [Paraburkholderia sabiae]
MKVVLVLTSHNQLGNTGKPTGFWLEEFTAPYYVFTDAGASVTVASPKGGHPPIDPRSDDPNNQTDSMLRFKEDSATQKVLANSATLSSIKADDYDTIFYAGGHGPMWDLTNDKDSIALIESFYNAGKPVAAVCHGPCVLLKATYQGQPLVKGKRVTCFTNDEEEAVGLTKVMPFLVEDELKRLGGHFEKVANWGVLSIVDGHLITGQNPASSGPTAKELLKVMQR